MVQADQIKMHFYGNELLLWQKVKVHRQKTAVNSCPEDIIFQSDFTDVNHHCPSQINYSALEHKSLTVTCLFLFNEIIP